MVMENISHSKNKNTVIKMLDSAYTSYCDNLLNTGSPNNNKRFWLYIKRKRKRKTPNISSLRNGDY